MLLKELPNHFNPFKICRGAPLEGLAWEGQVYFKDLPELCDSLRTQPQAFVALNLLFKQDSQNVCIIEGKLSSKVNLVCQRCLEMMPYELHSTFIVAPVEEESAANHLPSDYEPLLAPNGEVSLDKWIAEELHLALPLAPCHEPSCKPGYEGAESENNSDSKISKNPFAILAHKKKTN